MSKPSLLEYHLLSSAHCWFNLQALSGFHRPFGYALPYGDYSQILLLFIHQYYWLLRYVLRGYRYPTFCLLCRLSGSRVQQQKSHSQPPVRDSHPEDSNYPHYTIPGCLIHEGLCAEFSSAPCKPRPVTESEGLLRLLDKHKVPS